jgi:hypothetical protein
VKRGISTENQYCQGHPDGIPPQGAANGQTHQNEESNRRKQNVTRLKGVGNNLGHKKSKKWSERDNHNADANRRGHSRPIRLERSRAEYKPRQCGYDQH